MLTPKLKVLQQTIKRLMRRGAIGSMEKVLAKSHAADLAFLLTDLSEAERDKVIGGSATDDKRAEIIGHAEPKIAAQILSRAEPERAVELLRLVEPDDVSDILGEMPSEAADELLHLMRVSDRSEVEELSRYDSETAGGIMSPRFFALHRDTTIREAIEELQKRSEELEMVFYLYVVNERDQLLGVVSLRQLVVTRPDTRLFDIMISDVIKVTADVDQEEVARLASRYGLLAVPVEDDSNRLVGIVTVDDVIDVLREEATEDILRMAGAGDELVDQETVLGSAFSRFPWLLVTGALGVLAALILAGYKETLQLNAVAVYFMPAVLALAGISALQSATIVGQSIGQGRMTWGLVLRQIGVSALLGTFFGAGLAIFAGYWWIAGGNQSIWGAVFLGLGITAAMISAAIVGGVLPPLLARLRIDPTLAAGPAITVVGDLVGLVVYLSIGSLGLLF
jgi:magnesium transporter